MEVVKFIDDTYQSSSTNTIIMSSSVKKGMMCIKRKFLIAQQGKPFWRKQW